MTTLTPMPQVNGGVQNPNLMTPSAPSPTGGKGGGTGFSANVDLNTNSVFKLVEEQQKMKDLLKAVEKQRSSMDANKPQVQTANKNPVSDTKEASNKTKLDQAIDKIKEIIKLIQKKIELLLNPQKEDNDPRLKEKQEVEFKPEEGNDSSGAENGQANAAPSGGGDTGVSVSVSPESSTDASTNTADTANVANNVGFNGNVGVADNANLGLDGTQLNILA